MLSTKIRTTSIALVASFSFAAAVPTVSQAQIYSPAKICAAWQASYEKKLSMKTQFSKELAEKLKREAKAFGCKWAGGTLFLETAPEGEATSPVSPVSGVVAPPVAIA